jgi:DNA mismatch repair ATPase MutS
LAEETEGVSNYFVSAVVQDSKLTMLYRVQPGKVDKSYGLFVAEMLKFPE